MESNKLIRTSIKGLLFHENKLLILRKATSEGLWDFPGGRIEFAEAPEETLKREVVEETSLKIDLLYPISTWSYLKDETTFLIGIIFLCQANSFDVKLSSEHSQYVWIDFEDIEKYNIAPSYLKDLKKYKWKDINEKLTLHKAFTSENIK